MDGPFTESKGLDTDRPGAYYIVYRYIDNG
jgi:hypothetical protein